MHATDGLGLGRLVPRVRSAAIKPLKANLMVIRFFFSENFTRAQKLILQIKKKKKGPVPLNIEETEALKCRKN